MEAMQKLVASLALIFSVAGCVEAPATSSREAEKYYRLDLSLQVNCNKKQPGCQRNRGLLVLEPGGTYHIAGTAPADAKILTIEDCTGEKIWYNTDRKFSIQYTMPERVRDKLCYVSVAAYAPKYRVSMALMDVRNVKNPMRARVMCNQTELNLDGVGICQTRVGKLSIVEFPEDVYVYTESGCPAPQGGPRIYDIVTTTGGKCWWKFMTKKDFTREFRFTIYSYDEYFMEGR